MTDRRLGRTVEIRRRQISDAGENRSGKPAGATAANNEETKHHCCRDAARLSNFRFLSDEGAARIQNAKRAREKLAEFNAR